MKFNIEYYILQIDHNDFYYHYLDTYFEIIVGIDYSIYISIITIALRTAITTKSFSIIVMEIPNLQHLMITAFRILDFTILK
jgi:hypothetical protein